MRRLLFLTAILLANVTMMSAAKKQTSPIDRIDPTDWFVGMKNPQVQLMVYGKGIRDAVSVSTDYPGVHIDSLVRLDSPNYLLIYMNIHAAQPGTMTLNFDLKNQKGRVKTYAVPYTLKARSMPGNQRKGFDISDVLYMLMPDRFAQGKGHNPQLPGMRSYKEDRSQPSLRHGGDLNGIREHLDYFCQLGVTALWLTPVLENDSPDDARGYSTYHGYATTDYYRVDPRFGTNDDYRQLVSEAHAKGLKVVMDMIFNHSGFEHPWTSDMPTKDWLNLEPTPSPSRAGGEPEMSNPSNDTSEKSAEGIYGLKLYNLPSRTGGGGGGFHLTSYKLTPVKDPYASKVDLRETVDGWFVPTMPDLNQKNPHLMTYLIQNSKWWIETVGIDGIRMDTYPYADAAGMARWMKELDEEYPNFNTVGETWVTEPAYTASWQKNSRLSPVNSYLKTVMDFSFFDKLSQAKNEETDPWWQGLNRLYNSFVYDYLYEDPTHVMAFIDNHDTDRFLGDKMDTLMLKQALTLLLTVRRIPQLYYGTEILMNGTKAITDGHVRKDFPGGFPGDAANAFTGQGLTKAQQSMFTWTSRLLHWRKGNKIVSHGRMTQFIPYNGIYVIARQYQGKTALTVLNGTTSPAKMSVKRYAEVIGDTKRAKDILTGRYFDLSKDVELRPRQSLILEY